MPPAEPDIFPASPAQERVWFVANLDPELPVYNVGLWLPMPPGCDGDRARSALMLVVGRHEILRTSLALTEGGQVLISQLVHRAVPARFLETDLRTLPPGEREAEFSRIARADAEERLPMDVPPLWRARLVRLGDDDVRLVFVCHHAIFDGASAGIFVAEVLECHAALAEGRVPRLPDLPIQYADYTVWHRGQLTGDRVAAEAAYWRKALADLPPQLWLPLDRPRPDRRSQRGELHRFALTVALTDRIHDWSQRNGLTPFMTLLAAFKLLLSAWSGRSDIYVGCPVAGRPLPELTSLIGMFVHTVLVRTDLGGDPTFAEVARRVRASVLESLDHQEVPVRQPPYEVSFNLVPSDTRGQIHNGTVLVDLALDLNIRDGRWHCRLEFATDIFEAATIHRLAAAYEMLLERSIGRPDVPVSRLVGTLPPGRRGSVEWIDGGPLPAPARPVPACVTAQAQRSPQRIAVIHADQALTYAELERGATRFAAHLIERGAAPERPVAIALRRGIDAVVAILGALYAGAPYVAIDPDGPPGRTGSVLADADPVVVVADADDADLAGGRPVVTPGSAGTAPLPRPRGEVPAYICYTSGSTGTPNGVVVDHAALAHFVAGATTRYGVTADDRVLQFAPLYFDASVEELVVALCTGATLVVRTDEMLESVPRLLESCASYHITVLDLPTGYWHEVAYALGTGVARLPPCVRTVIIGGEAAMPVRVAQWHANVPATVRLINTYGPTEATIVATAADLTLSTLDATGPGRDTAGVPIGVPMPGVRAAVVDGELYLAGGGLARGYLNRPRLTAQRFLNLAGERAYRTGDLVHRRADGQLVTAGRTDDELKISGYRVDPTAVEAVLLTHPEVRDAAVVGEVAGAGGTRLVAYVVPAGSGLPPADALRRQVADVLVEQMVPAAVVTVDWIPRSPNGKLDRAALRDAAPTAGGAPVTRVPVTPREAGERLVSQVWAEVLGAPPGSIHDDFFDLGGQSLQTIQVATRLSAALGREVSVGTVFQHPTVAGLAAAVAGGADRDPDEHVGHEPTGDARLPDDIRPVRGPARTAATARTVLLTGATGFLGRYLLVELLRCTDVRVVCPVRAPDRQAAADRVGRALAAANGPALPGGRVTAVPADLARPALGLDPDTYAVLAHEIDAVYHAGAVVSLARGYSSLRATNVVGTTEVLRLAATGRPCAVHHISTIAVEQLDRAEAGGLGTAGTTEGYRVSKWMAEQLVQAAGRRGLPVTIYRLGRITGPTDGTAVNQHDLFWRIVRAAATVSALPDIEVTEPWTPVDWVARTIVRLSRTSGIDGAVHGLLPPRPTPFREVFEWVREFGFDLPTIPVADWVETIGRHDEHASAASVLSAPGSPSVHNGQWTRAAAAALDCPPTDCALVHRYLATAVADGLLPPPGRPIR